LKLQGRPPILVLKERMSNEIIELLHHSKQLSVDANYSKGICLTRQWKDMAALKHDEN
jgi:hypothetical protein